MTKRKHFRQPFGVGRFYTLVFPLPSGEKLECIGKTCWTKKVDEQHHESGIQFWKIGEKTQAKLEAYIDQQCA